MGKSNPDVILLQDIKNRDPIFTGGHHANIITVIFRNQSHNSCNPLVKGKASLLIFCTITGISYTDTGKGICFVDIKSTAIIFDNFKRH